LDNDTIRMKIHHLYISSGHNYFGHYGKPAGKNVMVECEQIECIAGKGVIGDRFFDYKQDYKGQITFFSLEVYQSLLKKLGVEGVCPSAVRRNVVVSGVDLNSLIGQEFELQGVQFSGSAECSPCFWMDEAIAPGAEDFLQGQGGLRARILTDGVLKLAQATT